MASEISQMSDSSIVIIQGTVGLYTVATRCHTCFAVTLKYTEDSSLTILRHSLVLQLNLVIWYNVHVPSGQALTIVRNVQKSSHCQT